MTQRSCAAPRRSLKYRDTFSLRSRRLEVVGRRKNGRARRRPARGEVPHPSRVSLARARSFLSPTTSKPHIGCVHTLPESFLYQRAFTEAITIRWPQTQNETVLCTFCSFCFVCFCFFVFTRAGTAQGIQFIERLSVDWAMAYKNLKTKEKNSRGDSQKWSVAYGSSRWRKLFIIAFKSQIKYI